MRLYAGVAAAIGWLALALQLVLMLSRDDGLGIVAHAVNFFSYFTILSNILAAAMLTVVALDGQSRVARWLQRPSVVTAITVYMTITGLIYAIILRALWSPTGLDYLADALLHYVQPVIVVLFWFLFLPRGFLSRSGIPTMLAFPIGYAAYSLIRGPLANWYPYPFIDASMLTGGQLMINVVLVALAFVVVAFAFITLDRVLADARSRRA